MANSNNQNSYHFNYLEQLLKKQQEINDNLSITVQTLDQKLKTSQHKQVQQFKDLNFKLAQTEAVSNQVMETVKGQETISNQIIEKLEDMDKSLVKNQESEGLINQAILDQLSFQDQTSKQMFHKLNDYESMATKLNSQLEKHDELFKEVSEKLELQEVFHKTVLERMDQQDALSEKIMRQLEHIRSTLFERANTILEKIEENFSKSKSLIQRFIPDNKQRYFMNRAEEEEQKIAK